MSQKDIDSSYYLTLDDSILKCQRISIISRYNFLKMLIGFLKLRNFLLCVRNGNKSRKKMRMGENLPLLGF